jgi:hypothetical protein
MSNNRSPKVTLQEENDIVTQSNKSDIGISCVETSVVETPQQCLQQGSSYTVAGTAKGHAGFLLMHLDSPPLWSLLLTSGDKIKLASPCHASIEADDARLHEPRSS